MSALFEPYSLRSVSFKNRVWLAPMCQYSSEQGMPNDWHLVHLGARATGGFGLIMTEAAAVVPEGRISPQDAGIWNDEQAAGWKRIADFVHSQDARFGIQLAHAGRKASTYRPWSPSRGSVPPAEGGWPTVGPSTLAFDGFGAPTRMSTADIALTVQNFAAAAERADAAGADVIEVHGAHGYLVHQFLSPLSNDRDDEYGGAFANRIRFLVEIIEAVRSVWPDGKPLFVRLSATDWLENGWDVEQSTKLAGVLKDLGVDLVDVSSGGNAKASIPTEAGYQVPFAEQIRAGAGIPTGAVGLISEPKHAEEILSRGEADVVLLARAGLRDPSWPLRAAYELGVSNQDASWPDQHIRGSWDQAPASR
ncbi:NADH:flavin oxidoreductase/NADH oxidase [Saxibacter everestensis]|uniref:NADH:flavin oxidoreductase/NADH oxidase n=1 Tax=Saxibacter everestensis TaxID=2909229 RepID=A0ABY8QTT4_9MICO|nr:NADH:flavin oxidoreductase/NADH oxidase [Brevibacteriaceae bacterium ZFBP1038]